MVICVLSWWKWGHGFAPRWEDGTCCRACFSCCSPLCAHGRDTRQTPTFCWLAWYPWVPKIPKVLNEKAMGRNVTIGGRSCQIVVSERKIQAVLFQTFVMCLHNSPPWVFALHDAPMERWYYMLAPYPVISGCLSSKGPISRSAMLR